MTQQRDIERLLDQWFADGPTRAPDRVILAVAERIERQSQRPAWRLPWREARMNTAVKGLLATAAVIVAVAGIATFGRPSAPVVGGLASPTPSPTPTASPSSSPTPHWDTVRGGPCGETGCGGPLGAGTYTSTGLKPAVTYTLTSPWVNQRDWATFFLLYPDTPANRALAASDGYPPYILILPGPNTVSPSRGCAGSATDGVKVDAAGLAQYLAGQDGLVTTDPIAVTVGGLSGLQLDVSAGSGWTGCLPNGPLGETVAEADKYRYIALDAPDGDMLLIRLRAPADFDAFLAEAMPIVESFEFDLGPTASPS